MKYGWVLLAAICALFSSSARAGSTHDIAVTIDNGAEISYTGSKLTYTLTVTNNGPDDALIFLIVAEPEDPPMFHDLSFTAVAQGTASGFDASGSDSVDDVDVSISSGSSVVYTIISGVDRDAALFGAKLGFTASVELYDTDVDPNPDNNFAEDIDFLFKPAVTVGLIAAQGPIAEGTTVHDFPVGTMSSPNSDDGASDYAVAINWGDGTTSGGFVDPIVFNEVQTVTVIAASGTFTLTFNGQTTGPLAFNATAAQVALALQALPAIGAGNCNVQRGGNVYTIDFFGMLACQDVPLLVANGSPGVTVNCLTEVQGGGTQLTIYGDHIFAKDSPAQSPFVISTAVARGNLIVNGGFENGGGPGFYTAYDNWTIVPNGQPVEIKAGAKEGTLYMKLNANTPTAIYQDVPTRPGQKYLLNFLFASQDGSQIQDNHIEVSVNGTVAGEVTADVSDLIDQVWRCYAIEYVATDDVSRIQFKSLSPAEDTVGGLIDAIKFAPMLTDYEPSTTQEVFELQIHDFTGLAGNVHAAIGESVSFSAAAATFSNSNTADDASGHAAEIDWGDGPPVAATVEKISPTEYKVLGPEHLYNGPGVYQVKVSVTHAPAPRVTVNSIVVTIYSYPVATTQTLYTGFNAPVSFVLDGADTNVPPLPITLSVTAPPLHGILTGVVPNLTYTPNFGSSDTESIDFTVTNSRNMTATATIYISVLANQEPAIVGSGEDRDGDGFSDFFEAAVETNYGDFSITPTGSPITAASLQPLTVSKAGVKLNFAAQGQDSLTFSGTISIPDNFSPDGKTVFFDAGGVGRKLALDAKGSGANTSDSVKLSIKAKKGVVSAQAAKYTVTFKNGAFRGALGGYGLTNADAKAKPVSVTYTFILNNTVFQGAKSMRYTAKAGKSGAAK